MMTRPHMETSRRHLQIIMVKIWSRWTRFKSCHNNSALFAWNEVLSMGTCPRFWSARRWLFTRNCAIPCAVNRLSWVMKKEKQKELLGLAIEFWFVIVQRIPVVKRPRMLCITFTQSTAHLLPAASPRSYWFPPVTPLFSWKISHWRTRCSWYSVMTKYFRKPYWRFVAAWASKSKTSTFWIFKSFVCMQYEYHDLTEANHRLLSSCNRRALGE